MEDGGRFTFSTFQAFQAKINDIRSHNFSRLNGETTSVYLDNAGTPLYCEAQLNAYVRDLSRNVYGNPHSGSASSTLTAEVVENIRHRALRFFNADPEDYSLIFTSGCTASLKLLSDCFSFHGNAVCNDHGQHITAPHPSGVGSCRPSVASDFNTKTDCEPAGKSAGCCEDRKSSGMPGKMDDIYFENCSKPVFCFTEDSHTSVVGMREVFNTRRVKSICLNHSDTVYLNFLEKHVLTCSRNCQYKKLCLCNGAASVSTDNSSDIKRQRNENIGTGTVRVEQNHIVCSKLCIYSAKLRKIGDICDSRRFPNTSSQHEFRSKWNISKCNGDITELSTSSLFLYPLQSNFNGQKYSQEWINLAQKGLLFCSQGNWFVAIDAASFVSTSQLDLSVVFPDFVTVSFYKIFGFPTGLGALIVKNRSAPVLKKTYFGGGTVDVSITRDSFHSKRKNLCDRFEDGTIPFLEIIALGHSMDFLQYSVGSMRDISHYTFSLARFVYKELAAMEHDNGMPVVKLYHANAFADVTQQGPIINFNVLSYDGAYIGYSEVDKIAQLYDVQMRTGCFCNTGACQIYLNMTSEQIRKNFAAGHVCGDNLDLIEGYPTGSCRVSFGYYSTLTDALTFLSFISKNFQQSLQRTDYLRLGEETVKRHFISGDTETNTLRKASRDMTENRVLARYSPEINHSENPAQICTSERGCDWSDLCVYRMNVSEIRSEIENEGPKGSLNDTSEALNIAQGDMTGLAKSEIAVSSKKSTWTESALRGVRTEARSDDVGSQGYEAAILHDAMAHVVERPLSTAVKSDKIKMQLCHIFLYPVKSCGAFEVKRWRCGGRGLLYDRRWMVVSENGVCVSQKRQPTLCLIKTRIDLGTGKLVLSCPGVADMPVDLDLDASRRDSVTASRTIADKNCHTRVCGDRIRGLDCGDRAALWLQKALEQAGYRLLQQPASSARISKPQHAGSSGVRDRGELSLANQAQYLLINKQSCRQVFPDRDLDDVISRFRANLVIDTTEPFVEENWSEIVIGCHTFVNEGPCTRCQMICLNQSTGEKDKTVLSSLTAFRKNKIHFGILLRNVTAATTDGIIATGDALTVTQTIL